MGYYRTMITIEVLSEDPIEAISLQDVVYGITEGHWSGDWNAEESLEVTAPQMAKLLIAQGSDPEFFNLDDDGNEIDEEEETE